MNTEEKLYEHINDSHPVNLLKSYRLVSFVRAKLSEEDFAEFEAILFEQKGPQHIRQLDLGVRAFNGLLANGIDSVDVLLTYSKERLLKKPELGKQTVAEIVSALEQFDLKLSEK